jgi:hypothetical protein
MKISEVWCSLLARLRSMRGAVLVLQGLKGSVNAVGLAETVTAGESVRGRLLEAVLNGNE